MLVRETGHQDNRITQIKALTVTTVNHKPVGEGRYQFRFATAQDLYQHIPEISDDMTAKLDDKAILDYVNQLIGSPTAEEAITFCSYLLPAREAVWWAYQCLKSLPDGLTDLDYEMLDLAEIWVRNPDDVIRYKALNAAITVEAKSPGTWVALGAGWSGGSMVEAGAVDVETPSYLTPRAVNAAILSVLAVVNAADRQETIEQFVGYALRLSEARPS